MIRKCPSEMLAYESDGSSNRLQFAQGESDRPVCSTQALNILFVCVCLCLSDVCVCVDGQVGSQAYAYREAC